MTHKGRSWRWRFTFSTNPAPRSSATERRSGASLAVEIAVVGLKKRPFVTVKRAGRKAMDVGQRPGRGNAEGVTCGGGCHTCGAVIVAVARVERAAQHDAVRRKFDPAVDRIGRFASPVRRA
jgi:hypothetical protein